MNIFIDIDNTICKTLESDYLSSKPIKERIEKANKLFEEGNTVVYWTARGSKSGNNYEELTKKQLEEWGCKYSKIIFGKPSYDIYIDDKSKNVDDFWPLINSERKEISQKIIKGWGYEIIFVNNDKYCGKILHFNENAKFSMHFHILKEETWYVSSGKFLFKWIDTKNADIKEIILHIGDVVTNKIGEPHQIICLEEGEIFEVSTKHYDTDSYRVMKGDSQK
jgi:mannose-6-phosphate isomerase-like protein (cupin superfamily)